MKSVVLVAALLLASFTWRADAATLFSFSQASQNWNGQNTQPHCTQSLLGGGLLTTTTCPTQVASGSFGPGQGGFATTYSSASQAFSGVMALGGSSSVSNVGDYDRLGATVLASSVASFDTMTTMNIPGFPANTLVNLGLLFVVTGSASSLTAGNVFLNPQSELRLGLGGPSYNDDYLQISAGFYVTQGVIFTGIPFHVLGYLSTSALSQPAFAAFDPNHPYGSPFSATATLDFAHTVLLSGATVSVGGQAVTNFTLLDENGNPFSLGAAAGTPEPGTFCLAALALLGLVWGGQFRRQARIAFKSRPWNVPLRETNQARPPVCRWLLLLALASPAWAAPGSPTGGEAFKMHGFYSFSEQTVVGAVLEGSNSLPPRPTVLRLVRYHLRPRRRLLRPTSRQRPR